MVDSRLENINDQESILRLYLLQKSVFTGFIFLGYFLLLTHIIFQVQQQIQILKASLYLAFIIKHFEYFSFTKDKSYFSVNIVPKLMQSF